MNCASRILPHLRERRDRPALWSARDGEVTFGEFGTLAAAAQRTMRREGLRPGDAVLVLALPGPGLLATVVGLLGLGATVVFVEPWMPVAHVEHVIRVARPRVFVAGVLGMLWGLRVPAVRAIPRWMSVRAVVREAPSQPFVADDVDPDSAAVLTFTSGTTGAPKGVVRTHRYMWDLHEILTDHGRRDAFDAPDLCVFPNVALLHLGTGRGAVLVPHDWSDGALRRIEALPPRLHPATLTCGPAFLLRLLRRSGDGGALRALRSVHMGGALTDCDIVERAAARWSDASWTHVYGGAEAEPVALADAREAARRSRARGWFQTLYVGAPLPALRTALTPQGVWVSGPNVAPRHVAGVGGEAGMRRTDAEGRVWHCMGDRMIADEEGWWFAGRASQPSEDFVLEQRIYALLGTSRCFVHRDRQGRAFLYGERLRHRVAAAPVPLARAFPELHGVRELRIVRDRRHRARIDRVRSLARGGYRDDA